MPSKRKSASDEGSKQEGSAPAVAHVERFDPAASDETNSDARDGARKRRDPEQPAAVVGIGASAGGIGPLQEFFSEMPAESGLAFVVVMHLSREHESNLPAVIQQKTKMTVTQVKKAVRVKPNCIYVIPPNKQLAFEDSMLNVIEPQQAMGRRVTIDIFFRTLAQSYGQRSVAIVLSGTDSDGAIGIKHIRAQGGVTIAQAHAAVHPLFSAGAGLEPAEERLESGR